MVNPSHPNASISADSEELAPQDRIIAAALVCMERDGIEACGIRNIAREAGVNSAAINYYFRSKESLIATALERSLDSTFGEIVPGLDRLMAAGSIVSDALVRIFDDFAANVRHAPRLSYAHLREALVNQRYDCLAVTRFNQFLEQLALRLAPTAVGSDTAAIRLMLVQVWSSMILLALLPKAFDPFVELDFDDAEIRAKYVLLLLKPLLDHLRQSSPSS